MSGADTPSHWWQWHADYQDPESALSQRLAVVVARTRSAVEAAPPGPVRLVSACAGQGRDVVGARRGHPRRDDVRGRLVELDPGNAQAARTALAEAGLMAIDVVEADAGVTDAYLGAAPADVLLLCGIFGNVPDSDIRTTVRHASMLCAAGAHVIWTRHRRLPDLTPTLRGWFAEGGFEEVAFDSPDDASFAVGTHRLVGPGETLAPGIRLFLFR